MSKKRLWSTTEVIGDLVITALAYAFADRVPHRIHSTKPVKRYNVEKLSIPTMQIVALIFR